MTQLFLSILSLSLSGALIGLIILLLHPITQRLFSKRWNYYIWLLVIARLLIPVQFGFHFTQLPALNNKAAQADSNSKSQFPNVVLNSEAAQADNNKSRFPDMVLNCEDAQLDSNNKNQFPDMVLNCEDAQSNSNKNQFPNIQNNTEDFKAYSESKNTNTITPKSDNRADLRIQTPDSNNMNIAKQPLSSMDTFHNSTVSTPKFTTQLLPVLLLAAVTVWLIGAIAAFSTKLWNYRRFTARLRENNTLITDERITAIANQLADSLHIHRRPILYENPSISSPITIGLRNTSIILPKEKHTVQTNIDTKEQNPKTDAENTYIDTKEQNPKTDAEAILRFILQHELIHVARKDLWYKWLYQLLLCIHWFNPILYLIGRRINTDCELSCDEMLLTSLRFTAKDKKTYGNLLIDTAQRTAALNNTKNAFSIAFIAPKSDLKTRLQGILHYKKQTRLRLALSLCVLVCISVFTAGCGVQYPIPAQTISIIQPATAQAANGNTTMQTAKNIFPTQNRSNFDLLESILENKIRSWTENWIKSWTDAWADSYTEDWIKSWTDAWADSYTEDWIESWADSGSDLWEYFITHPDTVDQTGDAWKVYNDTTAIAGKDICDIEHYYSNWGGKNLQCKGMQLNGSTTLVIANAPKEIDILIHSSFLLRSGKLKLVQVLPDNTVITLNETGAETQKTITMPKGRNILKLVAQGALVENLNVDYTDLQESDFESVYFSEEEEYASLLPQYLEAGSPIDKTTWLNALPYIDNTVGSEGFAALLRAGVSFDTKELTAIFISTDTQLSSKYLLEAIQNGTMQLNAKTTTILMPYVDDEIKSELLMALPTENFWDTFQTCIIYLDSDEIEDCLLYYLENGGKLSYSAFSSIAIYLDESTIEKIDHYYKGGTK